MNNGNGTIGEYTTAGATVNASLISGLSGATSVAVSGSDLFVTDVNGIGEYTTSEATVNASLVTESNGTLGIAVDGSDLFVANFNGNTIGEYTTSGASVNASLITNLDGPLGIAIVPTAAPVPEPSSITLLGLVLVLGFGRLRKRAS